jgi:hypothetical protein
MQVVQGSNATAWAACLDAGSYSSSEEEDEEEDEEDEQGESEELQQEGAAGGYWGAGAGAGAALLLSPPSAARPCLPAQLPSSVLASPQQPTSLVGSHQVGGWRTPAGQGWSSLLPPSVAAMLLALAAPAWRQLLSGAACC